MGLEGLEYTMNSTVISWHGIQVFKGSLICKINFSMWDPYHENTEFKAPNIYTAMHVGMCGTRLQHA